MNVHLDHMTMILTLIRDASLGPYDKGAATSKGQGVPNTSISRHKSPRPKYAQTSQNTDNHTLKELIVKRRLIIE